jgi:hypothetical protein
MSLSKRGKDAPRFPYFSHVVCVQSQVYCVPTYSSHIIIRMLLGSLIFLMLYVCNHRCIVFLFILVI